MQTSTRIIIIALLLLLSALFSSSETAFSSVNRIRLKNYANDGDKRAKKALKIVNEYNNALTAILIGNNIVNIASASLGTIVFVSLFGASGAGIATAIMTVLVLVFGEIVPKSFAKSNSEKCALFFAMPLTVLIWAFKPIVICFTALTKFVSKLYSNGEIEPSVTEDELKFIIEEIQEEGVLEEQERDLVKSALEFDEITVNEILIPRVNVIGIELNSDIEEIKAVFLEEMYSRLPVYDKSLDNIIGIITQKDFFKLISSGKTNASAIIQNVIHFSEFKTISEALHEMQKQKSHMAVVMDQYGGTKGIITMEDIIEELVGEIYDENDEVEASIVKISDNEYEVSGELGINDLLDELEMPDYSIESTNNSVGGWATELLGHIPEFGESVDYGEFRIDILSASGKRVHKIKLTILDNAEDTDKDNDEDTEK